MSELAIRRVVVACDSACELGPTIETATRLAAYWGAGLHGVFLEDPDLRRMAGLPFVRQIALPSGAVAGFGPSEVEAHFRSISRRAQRLLAEAASRLNLAWSFSVEPEDLAGPAVHDPGPDLLVLPARARPFAGHYRLPSRWVRLPYRTAHSVLLLRGGKAAGDRVVLLLDPTTKGARRSIIAAAEMAAFNRWPLVILAKEPADAEEIRRAASMVSRAVALQSRV